MLLDDVVDEKRASLAVEFSTDQSVLHRGAIRQINFKRFARLEPLLKQTRLQKVLRVCMFVSSSIQAQLVLNTTLPGLKGIFQVSLA
jgi:hypothetical protein